MGLYIYLAVCLQDFQSLVVARANQVLKDHGNEEKASRQDSLETQSQHGGGKRLYVGGLPSDVGVELLRAHFSTWGEVSDVYIPRLHRGGRANYCFVTFSSEEAAELSSKESPLKIDGKVSSTASLVPLLCECPIETELLDFSDSFTLMQDIKALRLAGARPNYHQKF